MYNQGTLFDASQQDKEFVLGDVSKTDLAYMGGIIDGEGSVRIFKSVIRDNYDNYKCTTNVTNTDKRLLDWIKNTFKIGWIQSRKFQSQKWKQSWAWILRTEEIKAFLPLVLPYLLIKQEHAKMVLEMLSKAKTTRRCDKLTEEEVASRQGLFDRFVATDYSRSSDFACNEGSLRNAYLAGLFDGEGCFSMKSFRKKGATGYCIDGGISNTCLDMLEWAKESTGLGTVYCTTRSKATNGKHSDGYYWRLSALEILKFSEMIKAHVVIKAERVDLVHQYIFRQHKLLRQMASIKKQLRRRMKELNRKGKEPHAELHTP